MALRLVSLGQQLVFEVEERLWNFQAAILARSRWLQELHRLTQMSPSGEVRLLLPGDHGKSTTDRFDSIIQPGHRH